jgi:hypothetical protein
MHLTRLAFLSLNLGVHILDTVCVTIELRPMDTQIYMVVPDHGTSTSPVGPRFMSRRPSKLTRHVIIFDNAFCMVDVALMCRDTASTIKLT